MLSPEELEQLAADLESHRVERTISLADTSKFCEAICAFSNDLPGTKKPGYLVIGVDSAGKPAQINVTDKLLIDLSSLRSDGNILPPPVMSVHKASIQSKDVAVIEVRPSDRPPVAYRGRVWVRVGPRRGIATVEEIRRLSERRVDRELTWDLRACPDATLDDLALDLFKLNYLPRAVASDVLETNGRTIEEQLAALRLFDLRRNVPTNGAVLLFGKDPLSLFPGAYTQMVGYSGTSQADDVSFERRLEGDFRQILDGLDRFAREIARARPLRQADLSDVTVFDYPPLALHELLVNGAIHRNYEGSSTPLQVSVFSDRVEIINPGSLFGDLSPADFPAGTAYRNPLLAEAAKILGFANRFGRGIAIAQAELRKNGNPPAELQPKENFFLALVRRRP